MFIRNEKKNILSYLSIQNQTPKSTHRISFMQGDHELSSKYDFHKEWLRSQDCC